MQIKEILNVIQDMNYNNNQFSLKVPKLAAILKLCKLRLSS